MRSVLLRGHDTGASAVEFALVSVVLVTLLVGVIQFGYLFYQWVELTHAAREGARWAALEHPAGSVGTPDTVRYKVAQAAPGMTLTDADIDVDPTNPTIADAGKPVTVTVRHSVPLFTPFMETLFGTAGAFSLSSTAVMRIE